MRGLNGYPFMNILFLQKFGAIVLIVVWVVWGSITVGNLLIPTDEPEVPAALKLVKTGPAPSAPAPSADGTVLALLAAADAGAGKKAFRKCKACHSVDKGGAHKVGPNLWDVVGRAKAGAQGYRFSGVLAGLGGTWSFADLDAFLAKPKAFAPGTKMSFSGVRKAAERAAVIAYLRSLSDSPKPLP